MNRIQDISKLHQTELAFGEGPDGMRLHACEVFNWGTFHNRVWRLDLAGQTALLTGDIGSGKSTLVDAVTTLLVASHRISYNKAAGAEARERDLRSYVLGHYKSERNETGDSSRPVSLRNDRTYSVILGRFRNDRLNQDVTLAQVFWFKEAHGQPARFYVVSDKALAIREHFTGFGKNISDLRKRLRGLPGTEVSDSFPDYGVALRRRLGIGNEQALELFHQSVSMKSVGNLTDFVRHHMLEGFPVDERVTELLRHFDNLDQAHKAVLKAREQIRLLAPLIADCDRHGDLMENASLLVACREALGPFFAGMKCDLLTARIDTLQSELDKLSERLNALDRTLLEERGQRDSIKQAIAENGGDRIESLKRDIEGRRNLKGERQRRADQYDQLAQSVGLAAASDAEAFLENQRALGVEIESAEVKLSELQNTQTDEAFSLRKCKEQHDELVLEVEALRRRRSNIPARVLGVREKLCAALDLPEDDLPFVGELIEIRPEFRDWEGAAERALHAFATSLLVSDQHYVRVTDWIEQAHLGERFVYYRARSARGAVPQSLHPQSLARKLAVRPDSPFYAWLEFELARRFDHVCCDTLDQFRRESQAITRQGQLKTRGERHEKDDRHRLDDRTRYVLGWSNHDKIAAIEEDLAGLQARMAAIAGRITVIEGKQKTLKLRVANLNQLLAYTAFSDLDWKPIVLDIHRLGDELRQLQEESDALQVLNRRLAEIDAAIADVEARRNKAQADRARAEERQNTARSMQEIARSQVDRLAVEDRTRLFPLLNERLRLTLGEQALTVESCDSRERDLRGSLQAEIDAEQKKIARLRDGIIAAMEKYKLVYPLDTQEVDAALEAGPEYRKMLDRLRSDDLPRFEERFKELLNENTIREVANFQSHLNRERQTIRERIEVINQSLYAIDYNPNRYVALVAEPAPDSEIRVFQQDLRACTESALTGSEDAQYSEQKFLQVKSIIERFRGREGSAEIDRKWTRKVTDVRNWFVFSASERMREDDREYEHYSDSGGKSGGQKEKLAYTVLAASLAYQFGIESGDRQSQSFRFVVIDEAFGRGSDDSARYGLRLFQQLGLQLLIATPLQKIHVIEPYVAAVGFVHNDDGRCSMLRNLTIEQYRAERDLHAAADKGAVANELDDAV